MPVLSAPAPELTLSAHRLTCCGILHIPRTRHAVSPGGLGSSLVVLGSLSCCSATTGKLLSLSAPASSRSKGGKVACAWLRGVTHRLPGYGEACYSSSSFIILLLKSVGTSLEVQWFRLCLSIQGVQVLIPGWGAEIPHTSQPENQNIKQKQDCHKFNKSFPKKGAH